MRRTALALATLALAAAGSAQALTVASITSTGVVNNSPSLLTDGDFGLGSWWTDAPNVYWQNQTGANGAVITLSFDKLYTLTDVALGVDNNDFYQVQISADGSHWNSLFVTLPTYLDSGYASSGASMIKKSSVVGDAAYSSLIDFPPVQARYARIFAVGGDGSYAVSEVSFSGTPVAVVPEPQTVALMAGGLLLVGAAAARRRQR